MRIAIGGIMHESNTFAPLPTDRAGSRQGSLTRGDDLLAVWREAHHEMGGFIAGAEPVRLRARPDGDGLGHARRAGRGRDASTRSSRRSSTDAGGRRSTACCWPSTGRWCPARTPTPTARCCVASAGCSATTCRSSRPWTITPTSRRPWPSTPTPWSATRPIRTSTSAPSASIAAELMVRTVRGRSDRGPRWPSRR